MTEELMSFMTESDKRIMKVTEEHGPALLQAVEEFIHTK